MHQPAFVNKFTTESKVIFALSSAVAIFWCLGQTINVYRFAVLGAIFEILWLPMLAGLFFLPVICLILLIKEKAGLHSLYFYGLLLIAATGMLIYCLN